MVVIAFTSGTLDAASSVAVPQNYAPSSLWVLDNVHAYNQPPLKDLARWEKIRVSKITIAAAQPCKIKAK